MSPAGSCEQEDNKVSSIYFKCDLAGMLRVIASPPIIIQHLRGLIMAAITLFVLFCSWNHFGCSVNATILQNAADGMAKYLASAGYEYVNTDDCWDLATRDPATEKQVPDPSKFPDGFQATIDYVHK